MKEKRYNGWANYPTWATHLWIANDPDTYEAAREAVMVAGEKEVNKEANLRAFVEEVLGEVLAQASLASDLLGWALRSVKWSEIVEALEE